MRYDISKEFNTPHFKNLLQQYEQSLADGTTPYWGSDDLLLLAEYYVSTGNFSQGDQVIDYAMSLHPDNSEIQLYKCGNLVALNQWEEAEKLLNQQSDPNDREALLLK
ncbi:MAG: tetratricopeptide repeat protein, partial [Bacteroidales bacterium]|nr:tetratricopeptide repeat protein [Bacteroidales bacterium]